MSKIRSMCAIDVEVAQGSRSNVNHDIYLQYFLLYIEKVISPGIGEHGMPVKWYI